MPVKLIQRVCTSWVWLHGTEVNGPNNTTLWRCDICPNPSVAARYSDAMMKNAANHLRDKHRLSGKTGKLPTTQETIKKSTFVNEKVLRKLVVEWIIDRRHSFIEIEAPSFHRMFEYILNEPAVSKLPQTGDTIRSDCIKYFKEAKEAITERLRTAASKIHLSFDLSTSPNCKALLANTGHWTSNDYIAQAILLAIRELEEEHTGENISQVVYDVVQEYRIEDELGYFMMDNVTNNDTALRHLDQCLHEERMVGFDVE